jgi:hypothetical protein
VVPGTGIEYKSEADPSNCRYGRNHGRKNRDVIGSMMLTLDAVLATYALSLAFCCLRSYNCSTSRAAFELVAQRHAWMPMDEF